MERKFPTNPALQSSSQPSDVTGCSVKCPYFPNNLDCYNWVYDEKEPYIKRRKEEKKFICGYDGHQITNWDSEVCPKLLDEKLKNISTTA